ncbi:MAG: DUF721 domain-containing protein [Melioribacteraceae bacterium]|nr:DUF721 domain-containing protein [Melioribacteraceae bacterium]MCF8263094.1 DUF721 domain-containing protein [Melioribacteraceae bacterium]MCF8413619.1 DUF721 domain-containing protein [Melioribacteraceae bacterium]MCF8430574.1 DUF721 domain-containing protein [Melioribacteraceae bacterium]
MFHKFSAISDLVTKDEHFASVRRAADEYEAVNQFLKIFPEFKNAVKPVKVKNGVLFLSVDNSILRNEIQIQKTEFIKKINKSLNSEIIKSIKFVM